MPAVQRKIGILGGTFNPVHNGHIACVRACLRALPLDQVWIMPAGDPPHKKISDAVSSCERIAMLHLAFDGMEKVRIVDWECRMARKSYTFLTLQELKAHFPDDRFFFIIGGDSLDSFDTWVRPDLICACAEICAVGRDSTTFDALLAKCRAMERKYGHPFHAVRMEPVPISSTVIRSGHFDRRYVPEPVLRYIAAHRLYEERESTCMESEQMTLEEIAEDLKERLKPSRFRHTLGVMYTAASLAMTYGYPLEPAMYAGMLHDSAKYLSGAELLTLCTENGIPVTDAERKAPHLLHAKAGAFFAEARYGVTDREVLHAITVHTTGEPNMSLLDRILFVADYIEPARDKAKNLPEIRAAAFHDLDRACALILRDTLVYLKDSGQEVDDTTEKTYEFYRKAAEDRAWTKKNS